MVLQVEIGGVRTLYTGDFSREADRHLMGAELPPPALAPHVVISERLAGPAYWLQLMVVVQHLWSTESPSKSGA